MSDKIREALELCIDVIQRFSYRWAGAGTHPSTALEAARAALAQQPAPAVAEGWKLVPLEPTIDMEDAGRNASDGYMRLGEAWSIYRAMLAAAPAAPVAVQEPVAWMLDGTIYTELWAAEGYLLLSPGKSIIPLYTAPPAVDQPNHSGDSTDMVHCACGDAYQASSYGAGFIDGSGMCPNCDAAIPARDIGVVAVPRDLLDELDQFLTDALTAADLVRRGGRSKALADRLREHFTSASKLRALLAGGDK